MTELIPAGLLSDEQVLARAEVLAASEREAAAEFLEVLAVIDRKKLYLPSYSSTFDYCRRRLRLSEETTYKRIRIARVIARFPRVLDMIRTGDTSYSHLVQVAARLTADNHETVLARIKGKSFREVERIAASIESGPLALPFQPAAAVPESSRADVRPNRPDAPILELSSEPDLAPAREPRDEIQYLSADRVSFRFVGGEALRRDLALVADLLRRKYPDARLEDLLGEATQALLATIDPARQISRRPGKMTGSRRIPLWVKRVVCQRDGNRCAWVDSATGCRCEETTFLEYDHIIPWAQGGRSDDPGNIRRLCRAHNQWRAREEDRPTVRADSHPSKR